jgi:hypothetical protein
MMVTQTTPTDVARAVSLIAVVMVSFAKAWTLMILLMNSVMKVPLTATLLLIHVAPLADLPRAEIASSTPVKSVTSGV